MSQSCARWRGDIGAYILDALDREAGSRLRRHMDACAACRADYEDLLPVRGWLSRLVA
jgi:anti-sigma factor RsiW